MNVTAKYLGPLSGLRLSTGVVKRGDSLSLPVDVAAELHLDCPDSWSVPKSAKDRAKAIAREREAMNKALNNPVPVDELPETTDTETD